MKIQYYLSATGEPVARVWVARVLRGARQMRLDITREGSAYRIGWGEGRSSGDMMIEQRADKAAKAAAAPRFAYALADDGSFVAICHERKLAAYAYPSSDNAIAAKRQPEHVARLMIDSEARFLAACPSARTFADKKYARACSEIAAGPSPLTFADEEYARARSEIAAGNHRMG